MTDNQKQQITAMRESGNGYKRIAQAIGLSENTVKSFCKRNNVNTSGCAVSLPSENACKCCGKKVPQVQGRKQKKFCSDHCRMKWWNSHLDLVNRKANYEFVCPVCKSSYTAYGNKNRKYCSHECYIEDRFGGVYRG